MKYRFLIINISGDVTGTDDENELPDIHSSDDADTIIDTASGTFSNEDEDGATIQQFEPESDAANTFDDDE